MSLYIVMGVSGCGKSTVARMLAQETNGLFLDGDDFHSPANIEKMAAGVPLTDDDRRGWLDTLNSELKARQTEEKPIFLACSALRQIYRERLGKGFPSLHFIYLHGSKELIQARLSARKNHFMAPALLASQFATLEEPTDAIVVEIEDPIPDMIKKILPQLINTTN